jgi:uncharacterized protein YggE
LIKILSLFVCFSLIQMQNLRPPKPDSNWTKNATVIPSNYTSNTSNSSYTKISCIGNAETYLNRDSVKIALLFSNIAYTAQESLNLNNNGTNQAISDLVYLGLSQTQNLSTTDYQIYPNYVSYYDNYTASYKQNLTGYTTSQTIEVSLSDLSLTGKVIDTAVSDGGTVNSVSFSVSNDAVNQAKMDLIDKAMQNCQDQFNNVLNVIGYYLDQYTSIEIQDFSVSSSTPINSFAFAKSSTNSSPNLSQGQSVISIKIKVEVLAEAK